MLHEEVVVIIATCSAFHFCMQQSQIIITLWFGKVTTTQLFYLLGSNWAKMSNDLPADTTDFSVLIVLNVLLIQKF